MSRILFLDRVHQLNMISNYGVRLRLHFEFRCESNCAGPNLLPLATSF